VVVRRGGERSERSFEEEVTVLRQRNPSEERAEADDVALVDEGAPLAEEPISGDEPRLPREPVPVVTDTMWASPAGDVTPAAVPAERAKRRWLASWGQVLILLAGVASLVFGVGAVMLGGLAGSVTEPVVQVLSYDHTPLLGLIEVGVGVVLVICAFVPGGRWIAGPVGVAAIVGGALIVAELDWIQRWPSPADGGIAPPLLVDVTVFDNSCGKASLRRSLGLRRRHRPSTMRHGSVRCGHARLGRGRHRRRRDPRHRRVGLVGPPSRRASEALQSGWARGRRARARGTAGLRHTDVTAAVAVFSRTAAVLPLA
jgi:hypothetical protein